MDSPKESGGANLQDPMDFAMNEDDSSDGGRSESFASAKGEDFAATAPDSDDDFASVKDVQTTQRSDGSKKSGATALSGASRRANHPLSKFRNRYGSRR